MIRSTKDTTLLEAASELLQQARSNGNSSLKILMYPPRGHARSNAKNDGNDYIGGNDYTNFFMNTAQKHVDRITKEGG